MTRLHLFVYGTLMRGGCRHELLAGQHFLGVARTVPRYALYDLGAYPGLVRCITDGGVVEGELYEIDVGLLPALDRAEGAPELYRREELELADFGLAFAYIYQRELTGRMRIMSGQWINKASPVA